MLEDPLNLTAPYFRPKSGSPALTHSGTPPSDGFFDMTATFVGAIGSQDWASGSDLLPSLLTSGKTYPHPPRLIQNPTGQWTGGLVISRTATGFSTWRVWLPAAFCCGGLLIAALPDPGLWFLAPVALSPLFFVAPILSWRRAFLAGWVAGVVANVGIFHWIAYTAVTMSEFSWVLAIAVLLAFSVYSGIQYGVLALLLRPLLTDSWPVLTVPAAVVAVEFLWPNLFPWHLGNVVFRVPVLMQGMDVTGVYGASFVAGALGVALVAVLRSRLDRRPFPRREVVVASVFAVAWAAYGVVRLAQVREADPHDLLRLALVQPDITAQDKKRRDNASRKVLFERLKDLTLRADLRDVDAVVWPEGAFPFYFALDAEGRTGWHDIVETSNRLQALVRQIGRPLLFGTLTRPVGSRTRNSMVLLGPDGIEVARYDKRVLLAFGEYMPLSDTFPFLKNKVKEVSDMVAGDRAVAFPLGRVKALASICYEAIFPRFTRSSLNETGADLIVNLTNDAWFGTSGAPAQHLMVQVPRAVELRVPLVRLTATGISAVVLPSGDVVLETGLHERRVDIVTIPIATSFSVYREVGDVFAWGCLVATMLGVAGWWRRRRR